MGIKISGPEVVAFLEWLRKYYPTLRTSRDVDKDRLRKLAVDFTKLSHGAQNEPLSIEICRQVISPTYLRSTHNAPFGDALRSADLIARYRKVKYRSIFLYTTQDFEFSDFYRQHALAWSEESGDTFDFYDYEIDVNGNNPSTFSQECIRRLNSISCADISRIRAVGLPCMLVWSDAEDAIVPFADVAESRAAIRDRFRTIVQSLAEGRLERVRLQHLRYVRNAVSNHEDISISYRHDDRRWVDAVHRELKRRNFSIWYDRHTQAGDRFDIRIGEKIQNAKSVVVVWSTASIDSDWVRAEAEKARSLGSIVPIAKEFPIPLPVPFNVLHTLDLSGWPHEAIQMEHLAETLTQRISAG